MRRSTVLLVLVSCLTLASCDDEKSNPVTGVVPFVDVDGTYEVTADDTRNTCTIPFGNFNGAINIEQTDDDQKVAAVVDYLAKSCREDVVYELTGNTLAATFHGNLSNQTCVVEVDVESSLTFTELAFTGTEKYDITYVEGNCGEFQGSCEVDLSLTGERCASCFPVATCPDPNR
jgi:hypothetical protein